MTKITKNVSVMCFHDELCQVYNALMTALSLLTQFLIYQTMRLSFFAFYSLSVGDYLLNPEIKSEFTVRSNSSIDHRNALCLSGLIHSWDFVSW